MLPARNWEFRRSLARSRQHLAAAGAARNSRRSCRTSLVASVGSDARDGEVSDYAADFRSLLRIPEPGRRQRLELNGRRAWCDSDRVFEDGMRCPEARDCGGRPDGSGSLGPGPERVKMAFSRPISLEFSSYSPPGTSISTRLRHRNSLSLGRVANELASLAERGFRGATCPDQSIFVTFPLSSPGLDSPPERVKKLC